MFSRPQVYRLALETGCSARTIKRWESGSRVAPVTAYALRAACVKLAFELPGHADGAPTAAQEQQLEQGAA